MASIIGKRLNGRTYYYYARSERVHGQPRIVEQRYLGTAEDIEASLGGAAAEPEHTRHLAFGKVAAVWHTVQRLGLAGIVDETVGRQRTKVSAGTHIALAVLHRVAAPRSDLAQWWAETAADRFVRPRLPDEAFDQARFWRAMRRLGPENRERVEEAVSAAVGRHLDPAGSTLPALVVDVPNFATSVAPENVDAAVGMSLAVSRDGAIPLVSRGYQRDETGQASFGALAGQLAERHRAMTGSDEITLVFDAGQHAQLGLDSGLRFVGGLLPGDQPELLAQSATAFTTVDPRRFPGLSALDTRAIVFGVSRRVILTHSATLHSAQLRGFTQALNHATRQLDGLAEALAAGTYRQSRDHVLSEIARITRVRWVDRVLLTSLSGTKPGEIRLAWRIDETARARLGNEFFGKQLLVTDHDDWPVADVITAYRARYHLDSSFRQLNEPFLDPRRPDQRWTHEQIAVDRLVSVLAVTVMHLMRHEADQAGLDLSVRELLEQLDGIQETSLRYPSTGGRPRTRRVLTDRTETQQQLFDLFGLKDHAPRRARRN